MLPYLNCVIVRLLSNVFERNRGLGVTLRSRRGFARKCIVSAVETPNSPYALATLVRGYAAKRGYSRTNSAS